MSKATTTTSPTQQKNNSTNNNNNSSSQSQQQQGGQVQKSRQQQQQEHDLRMHELFPSALPDILEFESWWNERPKLGGDKNSTSTMINGGSGGDTGSEPSKQTTIRRFMLIRFFPETGQVEVQTDDAIVPLTIVVTTRSGAALRAWDLYVGASIDILGRSTTLHAASFRTMEWLDENCRRLWRLKEKMEHRLNRFVNVPKVTLDHGAYKLLVQPSNGTKVQLGGRACPGVIGKRILEIQDQLDQFQ